MYGIFTYMLLIFMVNVGKYTSPMDPMALCHPLKAQGPTVASLINVAGKGVDHLQDTVALLSGAMKSIGSLEDRAHDGRIRG